MSLLAPSTDVVTESTEAVLPDPKGGGLVKHQTHHLRLALLPNTSPNTREGEEAGEQGQREELRKGKKTPTHLL